MLQAPDLTNLKNVDSGPRVQKNPDPKIEKDPDPEFQKRRNGTVSQKYFTV